MYSANPDGRDIRKLIFPHQQCTSSPGDTDLRLCPRKTKLVKFSCLKSCYLNFTAFGDQMFLVFKCKIISQGFSWWMEVLKVEFIFSSLKGKIKHLITTIGFRNAISCCVSLIYSYFGDIILLNRSQAGFPSVIYIFGKWKLSIIFGVMCLISSNLCRCFILAQANTSL